MYLAKGNPLNPKKGLIMKLIKSLFEITKPGILFSNTLTGLMGFFVATKGDYSFPYALLFWYVLGVLLIIASSTTINNYIDKDIDSKMLRTQKRVSISGYFSDKFMLSYAALLLISGFFTLYYLVNPMSSYVVFAGFFVYVVVYTSYFKRKSTYSTLIGSISGACVPMSGYVAVSNDIDLAAWLLFIILFVWQMPHFYAIGVYRLSDYKLANIPILPVEKSVETTKYRMIMWLAVFVIVVVLPYYYNYLGLIYLIPSFIISLLWMIFSIKNFKTYDDTTWAKKVFLFSVIVISVISIFSIADSLT